MIFWINEYLDYFQVDLFSALTFRIILSLLISFFISLLLNFFLINFFHKCKTYQIIRKNQLNTNTIKHNIPTMGGIAITISIVLSTILCCDLSNIYVWYTTSILIGYALIGFSDDFLKLKYQNSQGLTIKWKYFWLSILSLIIIYIMYINGKNTVATQLRIPFYQQFSTPLNFLYILISYFTIVGTSNAVNLTDGLDGLAIMPIIFLALGFLVVSFCSGHIYYSNYLNIPYLPSVHELTILCTEIIGSGLGFLWFNAHPAKIFMGDIGSLSLGGTLGIIAVILRQEFLLIIIGGVFVIETLSVIVQILSFKIRHKRIFKMAPIHHHYEIKKYPESHIVIRFWIISLLLLFIGLYALQVY